MLTSADSDMQPILHRLLMAASSVEMRQDMNVEDEYYSIIKEQEGKLFGMEKELASRAATIAQNAATIAQNEATIAQQDETIAQQNEQLARKDEQMHQMVRLLLQAGMAPEDIARQLNVSVNDIQTI